MHKITITGEHARGATFAAKLSFDGDDSYEIAIVDPFTESQEHELEWHFEGLPKSPFGNAARARKVAESIREYGLRLFDQVFSCKEARGKYARLRGCLGEVVIEIVSRLPEFQALHWEALQDPEESRPLSVECAMVRKPRTTMSPPFEMQPSKSLNLLVVVTRPWGEWDQGRRTISRTLLEAAVATSLPVIVEFLRPGTFEALSTQLEARGTGYYHIVHFDCPWALMGCEEVCGREDLTEGGARRRDLKGWRYTGVRAFLHLEGRSGMDLVAASEISKLLIDRGVPICILNGCQPGKMESHSGATSALPKSQSDGANLGIHLMRTGLHMVVASSYGITASGCKALMKTVYCQLFAGPSMEALRLGRLELYCDKARAAHYNAVVDMEDWLLPVVYTGGPVDLKLQIPEQKQDCEGPHCWYHYKAPYHGFVGRDLEILAIEKSLMGNNALLLQGSGGTGKTSLLGYLREWWQATHFARNVFYFSYDEHAWTLQQILFRIMGQVSGEAEQRAFQTLSMKEQVNKLVVKLREEQYVMVLDDLENVTGQELAVKSTLPSLERARIRSFLVELLEGGTKVVLGSRNSEDWLSEVHCENAYELRGLDPESQSVLAHRVLRRNVPNEAWIRALVQDEQFQRLLNAAAGCPLVMKVLLGGMALQSPSQALRGLDAAVMALDAPVKDKTPGILGIVEYSYSIMPRASRQMLVCLTPFSSLFTWDTAHLLIETLQKLGPFQGVDFSGLDGAVQAAIDWGLLLSSCPDEDADQVPVLKVHPVFPYFLKRKCGELGEAQHGALRTGFKTLYRALSHLLRKKMVSKDAAQRHQGVQHCEVEHDHFRCALEMCIEDGDSAEISECLHEYFNLEGCGQAGLKLARYVCKALDARTCQYDESIVDMEVVRARNWLGYWHSWLGDFDKAREVYQNTLGQCKGVANKACGGICHLLAGIAVEQGDVEEAQWQFRQALDFFMAADERCEQARIHCKLGNMARGSGDLDTARESYKRALDIFVESEDPPSQVSAYHSVENVGCLARSFRKAYCEWQGMHGVECDNSHLQAMTYEELGMVDEELGDHVGARRNFQRALEIYVGHKHGGQQHGGVLGDCVWANMASGFLDVQRDYQQALEVGDSSDIMLLEAWECLNSGRDAQDGSDVGIAQERYRQALDLYTEMNVHCCQVNCWHELANVALEMSDYQEARNCLQQAVNVKLEPVDHRSQAVTFYRLGSVCCKLRDFHAACQWYQRALDIYIEFDDHHSQAITFRQLGIVAAQLLDFDGAVLSYQRAMTINRALGNRPEQAGIYHNLGLLAQAMGDLGKARQCYEEELAINAELNDRHALATTHHQLGNVCAQVADFVGARKHYSKALDTYEECDCQYKQANTYHNLGNIAVELKDWEAAKKNFQHALKVYCDFGDRRSQANTYHLLGNMAQDSLDLDQAHEYYERALALHAELGDRRLRASTCCLLGMVELMQRSAEGGREYMEKGLKVYTEMHDVEMVAQVKQCLREIAAQIASRKQKA